MRFLGRRGWWTVSGLALTGWLLFVHRGLPARWTTQEFHSGKMISQAKAGDPEAFLDLRMLAWNRSSFGEQATRVLADIQEEPFRSSLRELLDHPNWRARLAAATVLDLLEDRNAMPLVEKALADAVPQVREYAVERLVDLPGERTLALLEKSMSDPNSRIREAAVRALGKTGGEKALALVEKALSDVQRDVRIAAVEILGEKGGDRGMALVQTAFSDEAWDVREVVVKTVFKAQGVDAKAFVEKALNDSHLAVRASASDAMLIISVYPFREAKGTPKSPPRTGAPPPAPQPPAGKAAP